MKLISLYIENFGGLSKYALEFQDGITEIQAPNGFGKTTLAEFIRAMFYGFPRKGKLLEKDRRQKYTPWNGAKAGGNLVFEQEGVRYRIERTFGTEPKGDTFKLIDLTTGKKSSRYSRDIGTELFQIDADSFERSTYLPQLQDQPALTTAGIQAKLSDLVEDPGDVGNFDKAIAALKSKRSGFIPYRGSGGSVAEAKNQITRLQQELDDAEFQKGKLEQCMTEIAQLEQTKKQKEDSFSAIRDQITAASEGAARAAVRRQYADLSARHQEAVGEQAVLLSRYPGGIPVRQETEAARELADRLALLSRQLDAFRAEHAEVLAAPVRENLPDLDVLKQEEKQLGAEITAMTQSLLKYQQDRHNLQLQADRIPQLRDALEQWQEKMNSERKKSQTLDETMEFLQQAKDSLSTSYLGPIRANFSAYLERLMGRKEQILVNPDLEVQLERQGQAREMAYFSAGQTDIVMLCMRLALVDALFPKEKMFVVLDDPFVNLDDERTAEALELLKELGEERQIIYLTCNSSRSL